MRALGSDSHRPLFLKAAARKAVCLILLLVGGSCCIVLEAERHPFHTKTFERISKASCSACGYLSAAEVWPRTQPRSSSSFWGPRSQGRQGTSIRTSTSGVRSHLRLNKGFQSLRAAEGTATPGLIPEKQQHEREAESPPQIDLARALQLLEAASGEDPLPNTSPRKEGDDGVSSRSPRTPKGPHEEMDMRGKRRLSVIFNCMLHACERQGDALGGFEVYRQMQTLGVPPDEATFHSVAALMERTGEYNGMIKVGVYTKVLTYWSPCAPQRTNAIQGACFVYFSCSYWITCSRKDVNHLFLCWGWQLAAAVKPALLLLLSNYRNSCSGRFVRLLLPSALLKRLQQQRFLMLLLGCSSRTSIFQRRRPHSSRPFPLVSMHPLCLAAVLLEGTRRRYSSTLNFLP